MKKFCFTIFLLFFGLLALSQNISVKSFKALPMDMTASSLNGKRIDQNGQVAALIKIVTTETGFTFEGGTLGIVDSKQENGEVWVWVPRASRKITIKHQQLGVLRDYRYPIEIESERTYEMVLTTGKIETIIKEEVRQQYLLFQLDPPNAILEVDDKLWSVEADGTAMKYVDFGTYNYRVRASDYATEVGKVTVDDPNETKIVPVKLKTNLAEVTLMVEADAEIWVNNQKKGVRTWTGKLGNGTYKIECKQDGHETTMVSKEITTEMNGETITLPAPTPIYGSLMVESTPNLCKLYIDGKDYGTTPKSINNILVGQHEIRLTKDGYDEHRETITIAKSERKQVKSTMDKSHNYQNNDASSLNVTIPEGAVKGLFSVSDTKKVYFSKGNLQYQASTKTWRFAENQWDYVGGRNKSGLVSESNNSDISQTYSGWIDLFGWGTSGYAHGSDCYQPWNTSQNTKFYYAYGKFSDNLYDQTGKADWGYNAIVNGGGQTGQWRTLTGGSSGEWNYIFNTRSASTVNGVKNARYVKAKVANVRGVILFPDSYIHPSGVDQPVGINETSNKGWKENSYNRYDFEAMQNAGAVFLPAAGGRIDSSVNDVGSYGYYWSSSSIGSKYAYGVYFSDASFNAEYNYYRCYGRSVRLVCSAKN